MCRLLTIVSFLLFAVDATAANWSSCEYDLSDVSSQADEAEYAASRMKNLDDELESAKDEYETCIMFPDTFDLMDDGCQSPRWDYDNAVEEYNSGLRRFQNEMESLIDQTNNAISTCN